MPSSQQPHPEPESDDRIDPAAPTGDGERDPFGPPAEPCECYCLHCNRVFMSDGMWFQKVINGRDGFDGFWMCPTPNCDGKGFTFDIFPTDPNHPANEGWVEDDDEIVDVPYDDDDDGEPVGRDVSEFAAAGADESEWDPAESKYAEMDQAYGNDDDDLEGEEWKFGLQPGERPPEPEWIAKARHDWEEEQKKYDAPDERPRVIDASKEEPPAPREPREPREPGEITEDDIPF